MGPFHTSNSTAFFSYCIHSSTEGSESSPLHPQSLQQLVAAKSLMILASTFMFDISYGA